MLPNCVWRRAIPAALFAAVAFAGISTGSRAELPPRAYRSYQEDSPEALTIKVKSVKIVERKEDGATRSEITVEAQVEKVARSASGLHSGDTIRIIYTHTEPVLGGSQPDILREGGTYPAFLEKIEGGAYATAAESYSFRSLD